VSERSRPMEAEAERALLERAAAEDLDAFWTLVEPNDRGLRALAFRLLGDRDLMDEALQEAYLKAFRALGSFRGQAAVRTWLYRIVHNVCVDQLRRRERGRATTLHGLEQQPDPRPGPAEVAVGRHDLEAALASLSPGLRAAVLLVDAEGMGHGEAAEILGIPVGTVASRLSRARRHLRLALGVTEGTEER
jgi:RNA polymerase sigma-70 factor (ECF subfamily)